MATASDPYAAYGTPVANPAPQAAPKPTTSLQIYNKARDAIASKFTDPRQRQVAINAFDSDPRVQRVRKLAGLAPVSTVHGDVKAAAKQSLSAGETLKSALLHIPGSAANFGGNLSHAVLHPVDTINNLAQVAVGEIQKIPHARNVLQAIGADDRALQRNEGMANAVNQSYADRYGGGENIKQTIATDPIGALADASVVFGGAAGAAGLTGKAAELSGAADTAATASRVAQTLGKVSRRTNPLTPIVGTAKAAVKGVRNVVGFEPVKNVLRKYVKTPIEDIQARMDERARQGLPSSIYEVLPSRDAEALDDAISKMPANARERLAGAVRQRAQGMAGETANRVRQIITPRSNQIRASIAQDLARSRGEATPTPADHAMALEASRSPTAMEDVRNTEAANTMAPFDAQPVVHDFQDLLPHVPGPDGARVTVDPEVVSLIRTAAGRKSLRPPGNPVTVGEISGPGGIIPSLRKIAFAGGKDAATARTAIEHLEGVIGDNVPGAGDAIEQMREAYAARSRMAEGVAEGRETRTEPQVAKPTDATRNAYGTPEGIAGRTLGQAAELESNLGGTPDQNLHALNDIARSPRTQSGISGNLGGNEGQQIAGVAEAQSEAARRLGRLTRERSGDASIEPANIMKNLMSLALHTNPGLRAFALARLLKGAVRVPERQAHALTDMLFSTNPTQISRALNFLNRSGDAGRQFIQDIGRAAATGSVQTNAATAPPSKTDAPQDSNTVVTETVPSGSQSAASTSPDDYSAIGEKPHGRAVIEELFPGAEITEDIRDPNSKLGKETPNSYHETTDKAVDLRPIKGMTFGEFIQKIKDAGYSILESKDEVNHPSRHTTGPHWHVVLG